MWGKVVLLVILCLVGQHVFRLMSILGVFKHIYTHRPGPCQLVPEIDGGSEDMEMTADGKLFISSGLGNMVDFEDPHYKHVKGQIFLLDTQAQNPTFVSLPIEGDIDLHIFRPHGLSLWMDPNTGSQYIYVVNHPGEDTVEKFLYDETQNVLRHMTTFTDPTMHLMNDIKVVGRDKFYFTNFFYFKNPLGIAVEFLTPLSLGSVAYYDGSKGTMLLKGLDQANGINTSPDGRFLYVGLLVSGTIDVFEINKDYSIKPHDQIALYTGADNIDVCPETGDLYVGTHPQLMMTQHKAANPKENKGPSQVLRIKMKDGHAVDIEELYSEDGSLISSVSVAVYKDSKLYMGTIFDKMAICDLHYLS